MKRIIFLVVLPSLLLACSQKPIKDHMQEPKSALIIIGLAGTVNWQTLWSNDYRMRSYEYPNVQINDVVIMPTTVGTRFRITELGHKSSKNKLSFDLKRSPFLRVNRKGVYYYGVIETRSFGAHNVKSRVNTRIDNSVIALAKQKYPEVFKDNPEIIFRSEDLDLEKVKVMGNF